MKNKKKTGRTQVRPILFSLLVFARVSSREQNLYRQIAAFVALGAADRDIITDKESGKDLNRKGYQALKNAMLCCGDTLVVKSLDRLSRNKYDIHNELQYFKENGIRLKVIDLPTTMMDLPEGQEWVFEMVNNILIEVLGTIAEQERKNIRKRQAEGIEQSRTARNLADRLSSFLRIGIAFTPLGKQEKSQQRQLWSRQAQKERAFTSSST